MTEKSRAKMYEEIQAARGRRIRRWVLAGAGVAVAMVAAGLGLLWVAVRVARAAWGSP